jgi:hypothetical protein
MDPKIQTSQTDNGNDLTLDEERLEGYAASEMADRGPKNVNPERSGADTDAAALQGGNTNDEEGDEDYDDEDDDTDDIEIDEVDADVEETAVVEDVDLDEDDLEDLDIDDEDEDEEGEVL